MAKQPWRPEEAADALVLDWPQFSAKYPYRPFDSYDTKRRRLRKQPTIEAMLGASTVPPVVVKRQSVPKGWEPGVEWNGTGGTITLGPTPDRINEWADVLEKAGIDPDRFEVKEPVQFRAWDTAAGDRLHSYRLTVQEKRSESEKLDLDALKAEIAEHSLPGTSAPIGDEGFVLVIADPQIGSNEGGGSPALTERFLDCVKGAVERVNSLRAEGHELGTLYIASLGDIGEGCDGFYPQQTFRIDLNRRDQQKLARRLFIEALRILAPLFKRVVVVAVGGNHGENRKNGKSFTDFADNDDVAVWEQVADVLAMRPDVYGHVSFVIPNHELDVTLDCAGVITTFVHGHQFGSGTDASAKAISWWKGQEHGMKPAGESTLLLSGHFHHLSIRQEGPKTHIQAPALVGGSQWFENMTGQRSPAGMLTLRVSAEGWDDLKVIRPAKRGQQDESEAA